MKLTKSQIKQIIKEELEAVMHEAEKDSQLEELNEEDIKKELEDAMSQPMK